MFAVPYQMGCSGTLATCTRGFQYFEVKVM